MNDQLNNSVEMLEALRRAEQKYRSIFEHCLEGIWISESARVVNDEISGEVLYYEGMVQDITRRKVAEEERD
jgi:PAS domain-containing protein